MRINCLQNLIDILRLKKFKEHDKKIDFLIRKMEYSIAMHSIAELHRKVFLKYKGINRGKDVVLIAAGPSLNDFKPLENVIYVGVNRVFRYDKVKFDYMFIEDFVIELPNLIDEFVNYEVENCKKFVAYSPYSDKAVIIPEKYSYCKNVERYYTYSIPEKNEITFDIASLPLGGFGSVAFSAMEFILYTYPKKIYLAGCDCSCSGYWNELNTDNQLNVKRAFEGWNKIKEFAQCYYPDIEIISINPVRLKGIFKDVYTK